MKPSARNQLVGTVARLTEGAVNGHVALELDGGAMITGSITNAAIKDFASSRAARRPPS